MRIVKRILAIGILLVMTLGLCSCFAVKEFLKTKDVVVAETLEYMENKYCGQEFIVRDAYSQNSSFIVRCYPKGSDYETAPVQIERKIVDDKVKYRDTYFHLLIHDDIEADIAGMCKDVGVPMTVTYTDKDGTYLDNQFDGTKTYADYKVWAQENKWPDGFFLHIFVNDNNDCESLAKEIADRVRAGQIHGFLEMYFYPIETYTEENIRNDMDGINHTRILEIID